MDYFNEIGVGVVIIIFGALATKKLKLDNKSENKNESSFVANTSGVEGDNRLQNANQIINITSSTKLNSPEGEQSKSSLRIEKVKFSSIEEAKKRARILFIDDEKGYKMPEILKKNGWNNSKLIGDPISLDVEDIKGADVFFVDIHGIGKKLQFVDEGLGLANVLIDKFPEKYIVIYSTIEEGDRFHDALKKADESLRKSANFYEFEKCISELVLT